MVFLSIQRYNSDKTDNPVQKMKLKSIRRNTEFVRIYRKGISCAKPGVVVYCMKKKRGDTRIGITSSKKIGNAVTRNRARRVIRAAVYDLNLDMSKPWDLIFVSRTRTPKLKSYTVKNQIVERLTELGYYND